MIDSIWEFVSGLPYQLFMAFFGVGSRVSPIYLLSFIAVAWLLYRARSTQGVPFLSWVFPATIYNHASTRLDVKLLLLTQFLRGLGLFGLGAAGALTYMAAQSLFRSLFVEYEGAGWASVGWGMAGLTVIHVLLSDFAIYWTHRLFHRCNFLWPLHAVHHSAEVLSPLTVYRQHPLENLLISVVSGVLLGLSGAMLSFFLFTKASFADIAGVNVIYFAFYFAYASFRHSHIWLCFGPAWERILISPAQHQLHHSILPEHHHRNFGGVFAFWDWMFGTLLLAGHEKKITCGLANSEGKVSTEPYGSLAQVLLQPLVQSWQALRKG